MKTLALTALLLLCPFKVEAQDWFGPPLPCGQKRTGSTCTVLHAPGTNCDYERQYHVCLDRCKCFGECDPALSIDSSLITWRWVWPDTLLIGDTILFSEPHPDSALITVGRAKRMIDSALVKWGILKMTIDTTWTRREVGP